MERAFQITHKHNLAIFFGVQPSPVPVVHDGAEATEIKRFVAAGVWFFHHATFLISIPINWHVENAILHLPSGCMKM